MSRHEGCLLLRLAPVCGGRWAVPAGAPRAQCPGFSWACFGRAVGGQRGALHPLCTRAAQGPDWSFWRLLRAGTGGWGAALAHGHTGQPVPEEPVGACDLSLGEQRLCGLWLLALAPTSPGPALAREAWMGSGCQSGTGLLYSATGRFPSQFLRTVASPGTEPEPPPESGVIPWVGLPPAPEMTQEEFL